MAITNETKKNFIDRTFKVLPKPKINKGKWEEQKPEYLIFPKPYTKKYFNKQEWEEKITEEEYKRRLKECR